MNNALLIDKIEADHGITGAYGYDPYSENHNPMVEGDWCWRLIGARKQSKFTHPDGQYDPEQFYTDTRDTDLSDWLRGNQDAEIMAAIRYESHGPYGAFRIDEKIGFTDCLTRGFVCEAVAVTTASEFKAAGYTTTEEAFEALKRQLETYSDWAHGQVYAITVANHLNQPIASESNIYGLDNARRLLEEAIATEIRNAEAEILESDSWACRDVATVDPVPGAIGASL